MSSTDFAVEPEASLPTHQHRKQDRGRWIERGFLDFQEHEGYLTDVLADEACDFIERNKDKPFFAYVSFNAVHLPLQTDPKDKDEFPQLEGKRRQVAQMTLSLDRACGQIVNKLKELGLAENTLVVFTNDNGGPTDRNASSNYPFCGVKATHLEGGIRVPGIVAWPGNCPRESVYDHPLSTLDLLPTFVKAAEGIPHPSKDSTEWIFVPYLQGAETERPHQTLYWKKETRGTIRDGDWKLMRFPDRPAELFNLAEDPAEQNNLAAEHPEMVKTLFKKLFAWELELERPLFLLRARKKAGRLNVLIRFESHPLRRLGRQPNRGNAGVRAAPLVAHETCCRPVCACHKLRL